MTASRSRSWAWVTGLLLVFGCASAFEPSPRAEDAATSPKSDGFIDTAQPEGSRPADAAAERGPDSAAPGEPDAGRRMNCRHLEPTEPRAVFSADFEESPLGPYEEAVASEWGDVRFVSSAERATVLDEGDGRFLRIEYPEGTYGHRAGGAQWQSGFGESFEELWLSYRVRFGAGFDPVRGGKLPGLIGGQANTKGRRPNGFDGFSARMMWRRGLAAVHYVYHPDQPESFGEDFDWTTVNGDPVRFVPGQWHTVLHHVVMNTPGSHDGFIEGFFDGVPVLRRCGVRFRETETFAIDGLYFSTFFGGSDSSWATTRDETIDFDDFLVVTSL